jgi:hypothetical protein
MILTAEYPNYGAGLFCQAFGFILANAYKCEFTQDFVSVSKNDKGEDTNQRILSPRQVIDGDWPRYRLLNLPLPAGFLSHPLSGVITLAGEFRQHQFFVDERELLRDKLLKSRQYMNRIKGRTVILARRFSEQREEKLPKVMLRPTPQELFRILPEHTPKETLIIIPFPIADQEELWRAAGYRVEVLRDQAVIDACMNAETVISSQNSLHWWAGFLSNAKKVLTLTYGKYCSACAKNKTEQLGERKLLYRDERHDWLQLPRKPEA